MKNFDNYLQDLSKIISFNTELSEAEENAPFGKNTADCLNAFLNIAKDMGFEVFNYNNYLGEVRFGCGEEVGIMGHIDVVPAGDGWDTNPYSLTNKDGYLIARGVSDDKGPTLLVLYALKELKDSGIKVNKTFRLFVGCNEETGWKDVEYFNKISKFCEYGFSPDGNFPLSYAEKGISIVKFNVGKLKNFSEVKGGSVINAVCALANATFIDENMINSPTVKILSKKHDLILMEKSVQSLGKTAHGSHPELGKNAIKPLLEFMLALGEDVGDVIDCLFNDKFGLTNLESEQGKVTLSPNLIYTKNGETFIECDCRIPAPFTQKEIEDIIKKFNLRYEIKEKHPPVMVDKEGFLVTALMNAYNEVTGENAKPKAMCGSTFARAFSKGVAFGMEFSGEDTHMHEPNERVKITSLKKAYDVYLTALKNLCKI